MNTFNELETKRIEHLKGIIKKLNKVWCDFRFSLSYYQDKKSKKLLFIIRHYTTNEIKTDNGYSIPPMLVYTFKGTYEETIKGINSNIELYKKMLIKDGLLNEDGTLKNESDTKRNGTITTKQLKKETCRDMGL